MRVGKPANLQDVLGPFRQLFIDADVLLQHRRGVELGLVTVADFDITRLRKRGDDLRRNGVDLPWIQSHSRGTLGATRRTCKPRGTFSCSLFSSMCTIAILLGVTEA